MYTFTYSYCECDLFFAFTRAFDTSVRRAPTLEDSSFARCVKKSVGVISWVGVDEAHWRA